ncbi:MAG TPA: CHASE2 domain-containing protein [Haliangiales bacterium]|nr:CHASE2 domain-containing protein [Haliangiales bacterium]
MTRERAWRTRAIVAAGKLALVLVVLAVVEVLGLTAALDATLVRGYYALRGVRHTDQRVVVVGFDDESLARGAAPPLAAPELATLLAAIHKDRPAVVAAADPAWRLFRGEPPDRVLAGAPPAFDAPGGGGVTGLWLERDASVVSRALAAAGLPTGRPRLPINYVGAEGLPMLPAHRVARGELPAGTFAGRIVLLGVVARDAAVAATPVGRMTPAEIQAHALSGAADGVAWAQLPGALRWLFTSIVGAALLVLLPRVDETRGLVLAGGAAVGILLVDYVGFATGWLLLGAAAPLGAVALTPLVHGIAERRLLRRRLGDVRRDIRLRSELHSLRADGGEDDRRFWMRVAELARLYIDCRSSIVAELPADRWHLSLRVIAGASIGEIREKRRDVRRGSYRTAHLTLNPVWQDDFMSRRRGEKTLLVPLVSGSTLVGFWILNFPADAFIDPPHLKLIAGLAREIALAIVARRRRVAAAPEDRLARLLGEGRLLGEVAAIADALREVGADNKRLVGLLDAAPAGVCVASLWGELRYANAALRAIAVEEGLGQLDERNVADVLLALTPLAKDEVDDALRKLVREGSDLSLAGRQDTGRRVKYQLVLGWLPEPEQEDKEKLLVCSVIPTRLATRAVRASDFHDERTTGDDNKQPATTAFDRSDATLPYDRALPHQPVESGEITEEIRGLVDSLHDADGPGHVTLPRK